MKNLILTIALFVFATSLHAQLQVQQSPGKGNSLPTVIPQLDESLGALSPQALPPSVPPPPRVDNSDLSPATMLVEPELKILQPVHPVYVPDPHHPGMMIPTMPTVVPLTSSGEAKPK